LPFNRGIRMEGKMDPFDFDVVILF
jgi:hypothetical protein